MCSCAAYCAALPAYSPAHLALLRDLVASLALAAYAALTRMRLPRLHPLGWLGIGVSFVGAAVIGLASGGGRNPDSRTCSGDAAAWRHAEERPRQVGESG